MNGGRTWALVVAVLLVALAVSGGRALGADELPGRVRCQGFAHDPAAQMDTRDGSTPLGQWVAAQEDAGWRVEDVDVDVVVKASGSVEAWTTVCMVPMRGH